MTDNVIITVTRGYARKNSSIYFIDSALYQGMARFFYANRDIYVFFLLMTLGSTSMLYLTWLCPCCVVLFLSLNATNTQCARCQTDAVGSVKCELCRLLA